MSCLFFKQKTAYELRISDWSSDVCSSDLPSWLPRRRGSHEGGPEGRGRDARPDSRDAGRTEGAARGDRKRVASGKSVSVRVDLVGRRIVKKKNTIIK